MARTEISSSPRSRSPPPRRRAGSCPPRYSRSASVNIYRLPAEATLAASPELPEDILMCIFGILEIPDLVRASSVSTSWHSAYITLRKLRKYRQSRTPCLLYTSESAGDNVACLYSLVEKRVYRMTLPEPPIRSRFLIGSSLGFLVTVDERSEMHLVNPITGEQTALPPVATMPQVTPICDDSGAVQKYKYLDYYPAKPVCELRETFHFKAFVFHETPTGSFLVVLIHEPFDQLSFARLEDDKWTQLTPGPPHCRHPYRNCTYKDGRLYALTKMGEIHAFDLSGPAATREIIKGKYEDEDDDVEYILQAPWGGLLLVSRSTEFDDSEDGDTDTEHGDAHPEIPVPLIEFEYPVDVDGHPQIHVPYIEPPVDEDADPRHTEEIKLHKFDLGARSLVEIDSLPDHVLFLGHNHALCLGAKEYPALKGNHAYFTDDDECITRRKSCVRDMGVIDMSSNSKEDLVSPQLWSNWPAPLWIIPNLSMMKLTLNN